MPRQCYAVISNVAYESIDCSRTFRPHEPMPLSQDTICAGWGWHPPFSGWKPSPQGLVSISLAIELQAMMKTSITSHTAWWCLVCPPSLWSCTPSSPGLDKAFARPLAGDSPKDIHLGWVIMSAAAASLRSVAERNVPPSSTRALAKEVRVVCNGSV